MSDQQNSMECPHCKKSFHVSFHGSLGIDAQLLIHNQVGRPDLRYQNCPSCEKLIIVLEYFENKVTLSGHRPSGLYQVFRREILYPKVTCNRTVVSEVPPQYADAFIEACNVLPASPYASVMLSRRLLQTILHKEYGIKKRILQEEIDEFIASQHPPTSLSDYLHSLREIGNIGAHPTTDKNTGDEIKVEPEEAEWLLSLLEELFDFAYVKPTRSGAMKQKLNQKLQAAGRKPV